MAEEGVVCPHCGRVNEHEDLRCRGCRADLKPAEVGVPVELETRSLVVWALVFLPGLGVVAWAIASASVVLAAVGLALLVIPLLVQLFGADWGDTGDHP